jgi:23S rRNA (cytidine1920-2'-O)/16S rRNA (cytidine1409-2'-O)-methyltransferase
LSKPLRLDAELVRRGLAASRSEAKRMVEAGLVTVGGLPATRIASLVSPEKSLVVSGPDARFVSRGGHKLDGALEKLDVEVAGRRWLDAGASTGGFTDRLLQGGAAAVVALDVGYGQLAWSLRNDPRVIVKERVNARFLTPEDLPWRPEGIVADLSFISLTLVLPALAACADPHADYVLLVKPQFEAGRAAVGSGGVVRDPTHRRRAVERVVEAGQACGLGLAGAVVSPLLGPAGNREFFVHLRPGAKAPRAVVAAVVEAAAP